IPHLRTDLIRKSFMLLATLKTPIDFQTFDGTLVNIVVLLCSPTTEEHIYIQLLARLSRLLKMPENRKAILETVGPNALYNFFDISGNWEIVEDKSESFLMNIIIHDEKIFERLIECLIDLGLIYAQILDTIPLKQQIHQKLTLLTRSDSEKSAPPKKSKMIICPVSDREIIYKLSGLLKKQGIDLNMPGVGMVTLSKIESMVGGIKESLQF
ncbi:PTS sugar transporter subunit IIA, partial [candidate division KSB1 bacterium]|nr:PTS sugar transporter subunit IIA [candidate division KSB1 bacterium]